jgi:hypothetical protein
MLGLLAIQAGAEPHTLNMQGMVQRHDSLCWAAVSAMASRAFTVPCQFRRPSQMDVVFSKNIGKHDLPRKCPRRCRADEPPSCEGADPLESGKANCGTDGAACNLMGSTWLLGLNSRKVGELASGNTNTRELTENRLLLEIKERKAPVIISWYYLDPTILPEAERLRRAGSEAAAAAMLSNTRGDGGHFLIITGFDDSTHEVRVWDPWPEKNATEPEGHLRHKWISYERYQNPLIDNGAPVNADHDADEFALCRCAPEALAPLESLGGAVQPRDPVQISQLIDFNFRGGVPELLDERERSLRGRVVRNFEGRRLRGKLVSETGIATVVLTAKRLMETRARPEVLLESQTSSLVVPVLRRGKVVDSFLLVNTGNGGWQEGGYSNDEIARRLTEFRKRRSSEGRFYLLAIPEQGRFFVARGFTTEAELVPLDGDTGRQFEPASRVLQELATEIERKRRLSHGTTN